MQFLGKCARYLDLQESGGGGEASEAGAEGGEGKAGRERKVRSAK